MRGSSGGGQDDESIQGGDKSTRGTVQSAAVGFQVATINTGILRGMENS